MQALRKILQEVRQRLFAARTERRYAKLASVELLELYWRQRREHPQTDARTLYAQVVALRLGPQASRAAEIVRRAEQSFTTWPVERELRFRDVVHYLVFDEYTRIGADRAGTRTNMGVVVARVVPEQL
jgi:hypothetical protein